ncbi:dockerin type I domain-containing protein [Pirellulaceae bacterium SH449]
MNRRPQHRRLVVESLETRKLLAGDILHNFVSPEDTTGSGDVGPLDVLAIINEINRPGTANSNLMLDVDGDQVLSPLDALAVINHINRGARESSVPITQRIQRIETAIQKGEFPSRITESDAFEILATLRSGGRPELGDRVVAGRLIREVEQARDPLEREIVKTEVDRALPVASQVLTRLVAIGAATEVVEQTRDLLRDLSQDSVSVVRERIQETLAEHRVSMERVIPDRLSNSETERAERLEGLIAGMKGRLEAAGVDRQLIDRAVRFYAERYEMGKPLSVEEVGALLRSLGIDADRLFPQAATRPVPSEVQFDFPRLISYLQDIGLDRAKISVVIREAGLHIAMGRPITGEVIQNWLRRLQS